MMRLDKRLQAGVEHMGVDLRRRNVGMAEQLLDHAQVRAVLQQVRGEGMAQDVRRERLRVQPGTHGQRLEVAALAGRTD